LTFICLKADNQTLKTTRKAIEIIANIKLKIVYKKKMLKMRERERGQNKVKRGVFGQNQRVGNGKGWPRNPYICGRMRQACTANNREVCERLRMRPKNRV